MKGKQVYCLLLAGMILFSGCTGGENHADTVPTESAETADFPSGIPGRCTALGESLLEKIKTGEVSLAWRYRMWIYRQQIRTVFFRNVSSAGE